MSIHIQPGSPDVDGIPCLLSTWAAISDIIELIAIVEQSNDHKTRQAVKMWKRHSRLSEVYRDAGS